MDNAVQEVFADEVALPFPAEDVDDEEEEDEEEELEEEEEEGEEEGEHPAEAAGANPVNDNDAANDNNLPNPNEENEDGIINGGTVTGISDPNSAFMKLHIEMKEQLPDSMVPPNHPIYSPGVVVSIGLNKDTKLQSVFQRYCEFANSYRYNDDTLDSNPLNIDFEELEFSHCSLLERNDTAESSALMKNDRIYVRQNQTHMRKSKAESIKAQRESDRKYFEQLRTLLPDSGSSQKCDVFFHCKGKITDEHGYKQEVLTTFVRGHSAMISKRCPWLAEKIQEARHNRENLYHVAHIPESDTSQVVEDQPDETEMQRRDELSVAQIISHNGESIEDDDDSIPVFHHNENNASGVPRIPDPHANPVEDDEDYGENNLFYFHQQIENGDSLYNPNAVPIDDAGVNFRPASPIPYLGGALSDALEVPLLHPPEAVKLLLEYCYTNRVYSLGQDAFTKAFKEVDPHSVHKLFRSCIGPLSPYKTRGWPNHGRPTISLAVALAGIQLAEEARLPRLSLMCEIAASLLLKEQSILESLAFCEQQYRRTGNRLPHLSKAIMLQHVLGSGKRGVEKLSNMASFRRTLNDRSDVVVPSLMHGIQRSVKDTLGETQHDNNGLNDHWLKGHDFEEVNSSESKKRDLERRKWRNERWKKRPRQSSEQNPYNLPEGDNYGRANRMLVIDHDDEFIDAGEHSRRTYDFRKSRRRKSKRR